PAFVGEIAMINARLADGATSYVVRLKKYNSMDPGRTIKVRGDTKTLVIIGNLAYMQEEPCNPNNGPVPYDRHFEMFYLLAGEAPWLYDRPVPTACCNPNPNLPSWLTGVLDADALKTLRSGTVVPFAIGARIVCPMASFQSPQ
ncbi:MAG TPA: hypothetical protein VKY89_14910, partial [Thermoanaerobaculia bacterium]|nr:hypothetical protein [Thermoanaerobaculia bacterium]